MRRKKIIKLFLAAILASSVFFVAGCDKNEQNETGGVSDDIQSIKKVKQIRVTGFDIHDDDEKIIDFFWDGEYLKRVDISHSRSDDSYSSYSLSYNSGKLVSMTSIDNYGNQRRWSFIYNGEILVADTEFYSNSYSGDNETRIHNYGYTNGKITSILYHNLYSWSSDIYTGNITVKWNGDNVEEIGNYIGESVRYTYDNHKNPFRRHLSMSTIIDDGFMDVACLSGWSINNVVRVDINQNGSAVSGRYTYEYDSEGYPISITASLAKGETPGSIHITYY